MAYEVLRRLGRGGMGVVDLATDEAGNQVALKRLSLHGSAEEIERARARIRREAEVLGALDHPAIVRLLDVVDDGDDIVLVMPFLSGGTLHDRVAAAGPLHPNEVAALGHQLLDGLAAAHRQGIVHRDIKPANVLFDAEGRAHLVDFGVASTRDHTVGLTGTELVIGTPAFMAPEQARGEAATAAADVFSLGATLLFAATGAGPYGAGVTDPRVLMHRAAQGRIERVPRELPAEVRDLIAPLLDREAARRPTAAEARGGPAGTWPRAGVANPWVRARRAVASPMARRSLLGGGLALLLLGGAVAVLADGGRGSPSVGAGTVTSASAEPTSSTSTTAPCEPLPYQPCGPDGLAEVAPFTDGRVCIEDHDDYDGDPATGCESAPDAIPDRTELADPVLANLVPADDVDEWTIPVEDGFQVFCDGALRVTLMAPVGVSMRLELVDGSGEVVGETASADGAEATAQAADPNCGRDDAQTITARVSWVGSDRTAKSYRLSRAGSF